MHDELLQFSLPIVSIQFFYILKIKTVCTNDHGYICTMKSCEFGLTILCYV